MANKTGEERRIFLFKNFGKLIKINYKNKPTSFVDLNFGEEAPKGAGWNKFIDMYFSDEKGVITFFNDAKKLYGTYDSKNQKILQSIIPKVNLQQNDPTNMFIFYACDLDWAKSLNFCKNDNSLTNVNMNDYVGIYDIEKNDDIPVTIVDVNDDLISLDVSFPGIENNPIYKKFSKINLKPKSSGSNVFDVYVDDKQIPSSDVTFSSDKSKFTFNIMSFKGVAIKTKDDPTPPPSPKSDDSKKSKTNTTNTDNTKKDGGKTIINKTVYNYSGVDDDTDFGTIQSSDNKECKDFPFTLGCINDYIGDINEKIFGVGKRRANVFSTPLLKQLQSYGYLVPNDKDPKITEDIYNRIMKSSTKDVIKESVKKVLKEYINNKK